MDSLLLRRRLVLLSTNSNSWQPGSTYIQCLTKSYYLSITTQSSFCNNNSYCYYQNLLVLNQSTRWSMWPMLNWYTGSSSSLFTGRDTQLKSTLGSLLKISLMLLTQSRTSAGFILVPHTKSALLTSAPYCSEPCSSHLPSQVSVNQDY